MLTLDKAIKFNRDEVDALIDAGETATAQAVELGIEALKRLEQERALHTYPAYKPLPSETKE